MPEHAPIDEQIAALDRAGKLVKAYQAKRVESGDLDAQEATAELERLRDAVRTLHAVRELALHAGAPTAPPGDAEPADDTPDDEPDRTPANGGAGEGSVSPDRQRPDRQRRIEAFEARVEETGLRPYGLTQLLRAYDAVRPGDLSDRHLEQATAALAGDDEAQGFNADGFVAQTVSRLQRAPARRREEITVAAIEAAGEQFGGELLGRVLQAIENEAGAAGGGRS